MRGVIQNRYEWLKQATSSERQELAFVYGDGHQLWASDGCLAGDFRQGCIMLDETGLFQVNSNSHLPDVTASLPHSRPVAPVVVERDKLLQALVGQDHHACLIIFAQDQTLELSSISMEKDDFWRPETTVA